MLGRFSTPTSLSSTLVSGLPPTRSALNSSSCRLPIANSSTCRALPKVIRSLSTCSERSNDETLLYELQFSRFGIQSRDGDRKDTKISGKSESFHHTGLPRLISDQQAVSSSPNSLYDIVQAVRMATEIHTYSTLANEAKANGSSSNYRDAIGNIEALLPPLRNLVRLARRTLKSANWKDPENCIALHALIQLHVENMNYSPAVSEASVLSSVYGRSKTRDTFLQHFSPALKEVLDADAWPNFAVAELATIPDMYSLLRPCVLVSMTCAALRQKEWLTLQESAYLLRSLCKALPSEYISKYHEELLAEFEHPLPIDHTTTVQPSDFSSLQLLLAVELGKHVFRLLQNPDCVALLDFDDIGELCDIASVYKEMIHLYEPYNSVDATSTENSTTSEEIVHLARDILTAMSSATLRILQSSLESSAQNHIPTQNSTPLAYSSFVPPSPVTGGVNAQLVQSVESENEPSTLIRSSQGWSKSLWASGWKAATNPYNQVYQYYEKAPKGDSLVSSVDSNSLDEGNQFYHENYSGSQGDTDSHATRAKNLHTFTSYHPATITSLFQLLLTLSSTSTLTPNLLFEACTLWEREWRRQFFYFSPPPTVHTAVLLSSTLRLFTSSDAIEHLRALAMDQDHYLNFDLFHLQANMKYRPTHFLSEASSYPHDVVPLHKGYFASVKDSSRWMTSLPTPSDKTFSNIVSRAAETVWKDMQTKIRTASLQSLTPDVPSFLAYSLAPSTLQESQNLFQEVPLVSQFLSPEGVVVDIAIPQLLLGIIVIRPDDLRPIPHTLATAHLESQGDRIVASRLLSQGMMYTPEFQLQCDILASSGWNILYIPHEAFSVHTKNGLVNHLSAFSFSNGQSHRPKNPQSVAPDLAYPQQTNSGIIRRAMEELLDLALAQKGYNPLSPLWSTLRNSPHVFLSPARPERVRRTSQYGKKIDSTQLSDDFLCGNSFSAPRHRGEQGLQQNTDSLNADVLDEPLSERNPLNDPLATFPISIAMTSSTNSTCHVGRTNPVGNITAPIKLATTIMADYSTSNVLIDGDCEKPPESPSSERFSLFAQALRSKSTQKLTELDDISPISPAPHESSGNTILDPSKRYGSMYWSRMLASMKRAK